MTNTKQTLIVVRSLFVLALGTIIKTIISGDESSELYQQLGNQYVQNNQMADGYMSSDEDEKAAEAWQPVTIQSDHTE